MWSVNGDSPHDLSRRASFDSRRASVDIGRSRLSLDGFGSGLWEDKSGVLAAARSSSPRLSLDAGASRMMGKTDAFPASINTGGGGFHGARRWATAVRQNFPPIAREPVESDQLQPLLTRGRRRRSEIQDGAPRPSAACLPERRGVDR